MAEITQNSPTSYECLRKKPKTGLVVALVVIVVLFLLLPGVFSLCFAIFADLNLAGRLLFLALAAVCLFMPAWAAWMACYRRWTTGSWGPSPEERMRWRANAAQARISPLIKFGLPALNVGVAAVYVFVVVRRPRDLFWDALAALWIVVAVQAVWQLYRQCRKPDSAA
jgi:hypothetical protein